MRTGSEYHDLKLALLALVLGACFAAEMCNSQTHEILPHPLSENADLSNIVELLLDSNGFLWIRRLPGIERFDGQQLVRIHDFGRGHTREHLGGHQRMAEDQDGIIWYASFDGGILAYDPEHRTFIPKFPSQFLGEGFPTRLLHDQLRYLWLASSEGELVRIDTLGFSLNSEFPAENYISDGDGIADLAFDTSGKLWIASFGGTILRCQSDGSSCTELALSDFLPGNQDLKVISIVSEQKGTALVSLVSGFVYRVFPDESKIQRIFSESVSVNDVTFSKLFVSRTGDVWTGSNHALYQISKLTEVQRFDTDNSGLREGFFTNIVEDDQGNLVVATLAGFYIIRPRQFEVFRDLDGTSNGYVSSFAELKTGEIVVGSLSGFSVHNFGATESGFEGLWEELSQPPSSAIGSLRVVGDELWTGYFSDGLWRIDLTTKESAQVDLADGASIGITRIKVADPGEILFSTYGQGLHFFDTNNTVLRRIRNKPEDNNRLASNFTLNVEFVSKTSVITGTEDGVSVVSWDPSDSSKIRSRHYLKGLSVTSTLVSSAGVLYMGSANSGLYRSPTPDDSEEPLSIKPVETSPPLPDNAIYALEEDGLGRIWLSTNKGLVRLNPVNNRITIFDKSDGLQSDEFISGASFKDSSGRLYFGGVRGFNRFDPKKIKVDRQPPPIRLTDIRISNTPVPFDPGYVEITELVLDHNDHSVEFEFSNMDLMSPGRGHYKYRLASFDKDWIDIGNRNTATFTSLPAGKYVFRVVGASADGVWNYDGVALPVRVLPAPWLTWWAFTAYGLLALGLLLFLKRYYDTRVLKEEATRQARLMTATATRAMDELQDQLFVERRLVGNVRKHAASTIDTIEELMAVETEELRDELAIEPLRRTRQRLHCLKALEEGVYFHADRLEVNFRDVADQIFEEISASGLDSGCEIVFANDSVESLLPIDVATPLAMITYELVLNSVMHAFEGASGVQCIIVSLQEMPGMQGWTLEISDTGCGLPGNVDPKNPATLGMELINRYCERLDARFEVVVDDGTRFRFDIPSPTAVKPST